MLAGQQCVRASRARPPAEQLHGMDAGLDRKHLSTTSALTQRGDIVRLCDRLDPRVVAVDGGHVATVQTAAKWSPAAAIVKACQTSWYENVAGRSVGHLRPKPTAPTV